MTYGRQKLQWTGIDQSWRIAEEGTRVTAKRCSCPEPLVEHQDGFTVCVTCGREIAIRLGSGESSGRKWRKTSSSIGRPDVKTVKKRPTMSGETKFIGVWVHPEMAADLRQEAASNERNLSQELRLLIKQHLAFRK